MTLLDRLAQQALALWPVPEKATVTCLNIAENVTYHVAAPCGFQAVLRVHRLGYHSYRQIECELDWLEALSVDKIVDTHKVYLGRNGKYIQKYHLQGLKSPRLLVMFSFIAGHTPMISVDEARNKQHFATLGRLAAQCHAHVLHWPKPENFQRPVWDEHAVFGATPIWGHWRDAPEVTPDIVSVLQQLERILRVRLAAFGRDRTRFNLIHADMRLANLLVAQDKIYLIDFDDCGWGWLLYDFAAAISFLEHDARVPTWKAAWLEGYRTVREINHAEEQEIDSFIMLRRLALLAWIGSHQEAPEPQALAHGFAATTAHLARAYLHKMGNAL